MPRKKKQSVNKKAVAAALVGAAAVGVGAVLSNKKTRQNLTKKVKKLEKLGKKEIDDILGKIRDAKVVSENKISKISAILKDKEEKAQK